MSKKHLFQSERLGFRGWKKEDLESFHAITSNPLVMEFFPAIPDLDYSKSFIKRMQNELQENGFCYFATEKLENQALIGFVGLSIQKFESEFTPCIDIGWRIDPKEWKKGYASEGAKSCLKYAFENLNIPNVKAMAPLANIPSIGVMKKIGMHHVKNFKHPKLKGNERLEECVLYEIHNPNK